MAELLPEAPSRDIAEALLLARSSAPALVQLLTEAAAERLPEDSDAQPPAEDTSRPSDGHWKGVFKESRSFNISLRVFRVL